MRAGLLFYLMAHEQNDFKGFIVCYSAYGMYARYARTESQQFVLDACEGLRECEGVNLGISS